MYILNLYTSTQHKMKNIYWKTIDKIFHLYLLFLSIIFIYILSISNIFIYYLFSEQKPVRYSESKTPLSRNRLSTDHCELPPCSVQQDFSQMHLILDYSHVLLIRRCRQSISNTQPRACMQLTIADVQHQNKTGRIHYSFACIIINQNRRIVLAK